MSKKRKKYTEMNTGELAEATAEFVQEFVAETFSEPDAQQKKRWERAKRKRGHHRKAKVDARPEGRAG